MNVVPGQKRLVVVYGAGGFGDEVAWLIEDMNTAGDPIAVACFVDDGMRTDWSEYGYPVYSLAEASTRFGPALMTIAIGRPGTRKLLASRALSAGFDPVTLRHPSVRMSRLVEIGVGVVMCAGVTITTNVVIEDYAQINLNCTIGHNARVGRYSTLSPGVHVSGWVHIGPEVFVGTGATFVNGTETEPLVIGAGAVIGSGACVTRDVASGATVVGVPAKALKRL